MSVTARLVRLTRAEIRELSDEELEGLAQSLLIQQLGALRQMEELNRMLKAAHYANAKLDDATRSGDATRAAIWKTELERLLRSTGKQASNHFLFGQMARRGGATSREIKQNKRAKAPLSRSQLARGLLSNDFPQAESGRPRLLARAARFGPTRPLPPYRSSSSVLRTKAIQNTGSERVIQVERRPYPTNIPVRSPRIEISAHSRRLSESEFQIYTPAPPIGAAPQPPTNGDTKATPRPSSSVKPTQLNGHFPVEKAPRISAILNDVSQRSPTDTEETTRVDLMSVGSPALPPPDLLPPPPEPPSIESDKSYPQTCESVSNSEEKEPSKQPEHHSISSNDTNESRAYKDIRQTLTLHGKTTSHGPPRTVTPRWDDGFRSSNPDLVPAPARSSASSPSLVLEGSADATYTTSPEMTLSSGAHSRTSSSLVTRKHLVTHAPERVEEDDDVQQEDSKRTLHCTSGAASRPVQSELLAQGAPSAAGRQVLRLVESGVVRHMSPGDTTRAQPTENKDQRSTEQGRTTPFGSKETPTIRDKTDEKQVTKTAEEGNADKISSLIEWTSFNLEYLDLDDLPLLAHAAHVRAQLGMRSTWSTIKSALIKQFGDARVTQSKRRLQVYLENTDASGRTTEARGCMVRDAMAKQDRVPATGDTTQTDIDVIKNTDSEPISTIFDSKFTSKSLPPEPETPAEVHILVLVPDPPCEVAVSGYSCETIRNLYPKIRARLDEALGPSGDAAGRLSRSQRLFRLELGPEESLNGSILPIPPRLESLTLWELLHQALGSFRSSVRMTLVFVLPEVVLRARELSKLHEYVSSRSLRTRNHVIKTLLAHEFGTDEVERHQAQIKHALSHTQSNSSISSRVASKRLRSSVGLWSPAAACRALEILLRSAAAEPGKGGSGGLSLKTRWRGLFKCRNCFRGSHLINWLLRCGWARDRHEARELAQAMLDAGAMKPGIGRAKRFHGNDRELFVWHELTAQKPAAQALAGIATRGSPETDTAVPRNRRCAPRAVRVVPSKKRMGGGRRLQSEIELTEAFMRAKCGFRVRGDEELVAVCPCGRASYELSMSRSDARNRTASQSSHGSVDSGGSGIRQMSGSALGGSARRDESLASDASGLSQSGVSVMSHHREACIVLTTRALVRAAHGVREQRIPLERVQAAVILGYSAERKRVRVQALLTPGDLPGCASAVVGFPNAPLALYFAQVLNQFSGGLNGNGNTGDKRSGKNSAVSGPGKQKSTPIY